MKESVYVGSESELNSAEPEALCCDVGATSSFASSFLNCSEVTERVVLIQTAQGGTVMLTTYFCLKTYYVRHQTGEDMRSIDIHLRHLPRDGEKRERVAHARVLPPHTFVPAPDFFWAPQKRTRC